MPIDPRLLTVAQWLSPSYPLGSFAFSQGLERACADGLVRDARSLEAWLRDVVEVGSGRSDAVWIARAWHEDLPLAELDALVRSYMPSSDRLREAERQGAAFARITSDVWQIEVPAVVLPVALGHAARRVGLELGPLLILYLQGVVSNLVACGQRLMPLGQTEAQRIVAALSAPCVAVAETVVTEGGEIWSNSFMADIASMTHETLDVRIFQS